MENAGNRVADTTQAPRGSGRYRSRRRPVDGRTRRARRWRSLHADFTSRTGGRHAELCASLATMVLERETLDAAAMRGERVDLDVLMRLSGEIRRGMTRIGLDVETDEGIDGTPLAIAALRADRETEAAQR